MAMLPHFRPQWLGQDPPRTVEWLSDGTWVPPGDRLLTRRANEGLEIALETLDRPGLVLLPSYGPGSVTRTFHRHGYRVAYYPVTEDLEVPVDEVVDLIRDREPAAVLFINYFGFELPGAARLASAAREVGALVVADCARGLFSRTRDGHHLGRRGDVALFCLWKTLPVPNGGLVVAPAGTLPESLPPASEAGDVVKCLGHEVCRWLRPPRLLVQLGMRVSDSVNQVTDGVAPAGTGDVGRDGWVADGKRAPGRLSRIGLAHVDPGAVVAARRARYALLRRRLSRLASVSVLTPPLYPAASPAAVALRPAGDAADVTRIRRALVDAGLPVQGISWTPYRGAPPPDCPSAALLRESLLVVPTHQQLPLSRLENVSAAVDALE